VREFGIDRFIKLDGVSDNYGVADEILIDDNKYIILVNDKNPYELYVRQCVKENGNCNIDLVDEKDREFVYKNISDPNRKLSEEMAKLSDYLEYGEIKVQSEMSVIKYIFWNLVPYISLMAGFFHYFISSYQMSFFNTIKYLNDSMWLFIVIYLSLSLIGIFINIRKRLYRYIWSNNITAIGLSSITVLYKDFQLVLLCAGILLCAMYFAFVIRAFATKASNSDNYVRLASQKLLCAFSVSRNFLTIIAAFLFVFSLLVG